MIRGILTFLFICCCFLFSVSFKLPISNSWHVYLNEKEISKTNGDMLVKIRESKIKATDTLRVQYNYCSPVLVDTYSRLVFNYETNQETTFKEFESFISYDAKVSGKELLEYFNKTSVGIIPLYLQVRAGDKSSKWSKPFFVTKLEITD